MSQAVFSAVRLSPTAPELFCSTFSNPNADPDSRKLPSSTRLRPSERRSDIRQFHQLDDEPFNPWRNYARQTLTYDEQKAADAAFAGQPFNSDWSNDAKAVYDGIAHAMSACPVDSELEPAGR